MVCQYKIYIYCCSEHLSAWTVWRSWFVSTKYGLSVKSMVCRYKVYIYCCSEHLSAWTVWRGTGLSVSRRTHILFRTPFCVNSLKGYWFFSLKPVLNWANVSSRTYLEVFGEASWFLTGPTFLREPSWKYSSKLYSGSKNLRSTCCGNIRPIGRSLPLIGWEQSSPVNEEKNKIKMDDGVARFFTLFDGNLFICWLVEGAALSRRPRMR